MAKMTMRWVLVLFFSLVPSGPHAPRIAAPTAIAAMNFLAGCDALIMDLRGNGGGYVELSQLIGSYFFEEPAYLTECHYRNGSTKQNWSFPGKELASSPTFKFRPAKPSGLP